MVALPVRLAGTVVVGAVQLRHADVGGVHSTVGAGSAAGHRDVRGALFREVPDEHTLRLDSRVGVAVLVRRDADDVLVPVVTVRDERAGLLTIRERDEVTGAGVLGGDVHHITIVIGHLLVLVHRLPSVQVVVPDVASRVSDVVRLHPERAVLQRAGHLSAFSAGNFCATPFEQQAFTYYESNGCSSWFPLFNGLSLCQ